MDEDKNLLDAIGQLAKEFSKLMEKNKTSTEDKNNAEICAIVKRLMVYKDIGDDDIESIIQKLEPIYEAGHRHSYSNISSTIYAEKNRGDIECSKINKDNEVLDILADNILKLHEAAIKKYTNADVKDSERSQKILNKFHKLYDHINLEIVRLKNYDDQINMALKKIEELNASTEVQIHEFNKKIEDTSNAFDQKIESEMGKMEDSTKKLQSEYISILGIFASIVLAFTGGMVFSTSVFNNIYKASIYRTVIVTSLVGMVFIAMIWLLLDFIRNIQGQHKRNWWYIVVPETLLVLMIIFSSIAYRGGWFSGEEKITYSIYENNTEYEEYESIE